MVQAGQWVLLAEAQRWAEGRYLAVDLLVVTERREEKRGGELDRAAAILGRQALVPDADGNIWWTGALEDSVKHTVGVSKDLREGIRLSIEIIANDVVRRRAAKDLPLDRDRRPATRQARAALPVPNPVPALRRSVPGDAGAARRVHRSTARATAWTGCGN